jgi:hypothetical protein
MEIVLHRADVAVALEGPLAISSLAAQLTIESVDAMIGATTAHRARYEGGSSISVTLVKPNVAVPDDATRAHIRRTNARRDVARTSYVVIDAPGFWAATMRGIVAGMSLVSAQAPRGAASIREVLRQVEPRLEGRDLDALERDILAFRARHVG